MAEKIDNRFIVLSLMEDLVFPPVAGDDEATLTPPAAAARRAGGDDDDDAAATEEPTAVEPVPAFEEAPERCAARVRALRHLPSLAVTMGPLWAANEVPPYLERCACEGDATLAFAALDVVAPMLRVACRAPTGVPDEAAFGLDGFTSALVAFCGAHCSRVRRRAVDATVAAYAADVGVGGATAARAAAALSALCATLHTSPWPAHRECGASIALRVYCGWGLGDPAFLSRLYGPAGPGAAALHPLVAAALLEGLPELVRRDTATATATAAASDITTTARGTNKNPVGGRAPTVVFRSLHDAALAFVDVLQAASPTAVLRSGSANDDAAAATVNEVPLGVAEAALAAFPALLEAMADASGRDATAAAAARLVLDAIGGLYTQPHWKTRYLLALALPRVRGGWLLYARLVARLATAGGGAAAASASSCGPRQAFDETVLPALCADAEDEVRAAAAGSVGALVACPETRAGGAAVVAEAVAVALPLCSVLASDPSTGVRRSLATSLSVLCEAAAAHNTEMMHRRGAAKADDDDDDEGSFLRRVPAHGGTTSNQGGAAAVVDVDAAALLQLVMALLRDDAVEVQMAVVDRLDALIRGYGAAAVERQLLEAAGQLNACAVWRVRHALINVLPRLCLQFFRLAANPAVLGGRAASAEAQRFLEQELLPLFAKTLFDRAKAVRDAAVEALAGFADDAARAAPVTTDDKAATTAAAAVGGNSSACGARALADHLLWPLVAARPEAEASYLNRSTLLAAAFALNIDHDKFLLPLVARFANDPVANVRLVVSRCLHAALAKEGSLPAAASRRHLHGTAKAPLSVVAPTPRRHHAGGARFSAPEKEHVLLPLLSRLAGDADADVRHFAGAALSCCF